MQRIAEFDNLRDARYVRTQYDQVFPVALGIEVFPKPRIEQRGVDGLINTFREFVSETARFSEDDRDKILVLTRSSVSANNLSYSIARVIDSSTVILDPLPSAVDTGSDRWEVRPRTTRKEGVITLQVRDGDVSRVAPGNLLNDGSADYVVLARRLFERTEDLKHLTVREGRDGSIDGLGQFVSPTLGVIAADEWKYLFVDGVDPQNPKRAIEEVVYGTSGTTVVLGGDAIAQNPGPLVWALLPFPEIDIEASGVPKGVIEQEGSDLTVTASHTFSSPSLRLTAADVGKFLTVRGSQFTNNRTVKIATVVSATQGTKDATFGDGATAFTNESSLTWEVRSGTTIPTRQDEDKYGLSAPASASYGIKIRESSLITDYAKDFGLTVDTQESELRQRNWVRHGSEWFNRKGQLKAYETLSAVSGYSVVVDPLFAVDLDIFNAVAGSGVTTYYLAEGTGQVDTPGSTPGRSGDDGSLVTTGGETYFSSPTMLATAGDEELFLRVDNSGSSNDGFYTIQEQIDAQTVRLRPADVVSVTSPDANNGTLEWDIVRLYADTAPARVLMDDANVDLLAEVSARAIVAVAGASLADGETFTINDGINPTKTFEFNSSGGVGGGNVAVAFTGGDSAATVAASITAAVNGASPLAVTAFTRSGGTGVSLIHDDPVANQITLTEGVSNSNFSVRSPTTYFIPDVLCGVDGFSAAVPLYVIATTQLSLFTYQIDVISTAVHPDAPETATAIGYWFLKDSVNTEYFLDSVPVANGTDGVSGLPRYSFTLNATSPPVISRVVAASMDYRCPVTLSCSYCASCKLLVTQTIGDLAGETGVALENAADRAFARLKQVQPAHVELLRPA